jgi:methylglyoxal synthase
MKRVGLVAHDLKKPALVAWCQTHRDVLAQQQLYATGTTGAAIMAATGLSITLLKSGPLDALIVFQDPLTAMPHDVDVKALTRLATLYNVLFAVNTATADAVLAAI